MFNCLKRGLGVIGLVNLVNVISLKLVENLKMYEICWVSYNVFMKVWELIYLYFFIKIKFFKSKIDFSFIFEGMNKYMNKVMGLIYRDKKKLMYYICERFKLYL